MLSKPAQIAFKRASSSFKRSFIAELRSFAFARSAAFAASIFAQFSLTLLAMRNINSFRSFALSFASSFCAIFTEFKIFFIVLPKY